MERNKNSFQFRNQGTRWSVHTNNITEKAHAVIHPIFHSRANTHKCRGACQEAATDKSCKHLHFCGEHCFEQLTQNQFHHPASQQTDVWPGMSTKQTYVSSNRAMVYTLYICTVDTVNLKPLRFYQFKPPVPLKGLSLEIFRPVFRSVWMHLGLNVNRLWFLNFKEGSPI